MLLARRVDIEYRPSDVERIEVRAAYEVEMQGQKDTNGMYHVKYLVHQLELRNK